MPAKASAAWSSTEHPRPAGAARATAGRPSADPCGQRREPLPLAAAFRLGGIGAGQKTPPAAGHDPGLLDSRGWWRAFTSRSHIHPHPPPQPYPPLGPLLRCGASSGAGAGKGPESSARGMQERLGNRQCLSLKKERWGPVSRPPEVTRSGARRLRCLDVSCP
jgi:hypothetical protein